MRTSVELLQGPLNIFYCSQGGENSVGCFTQAMRPAGDDQSLDAQPEVIYIVCRNHGTVIGIESAVESPLTVTGIGTFPPESLPYMPAGLNFETSGVPFSDEEAEAVRQQVEKELRAKLGNGVVVKAVPEEGDIATELHFAQHVISVLSEFASSLSGIHPREIFDKAIEAAKIGGKLRITDTVTH